MTKVMTGGIRVNTVSKEIFGRILFSLTVLKLKRHICSVKNSLLGHDLPISVNDRVISPFHEDSIFTEINICEVSRK